MGGRIVILDDFNGAAQLLASTGGNLWNNSNSIYASNLILFIAFLIYNLMISNCMP